VIFGGPGEEDIVDNVADKMSGPAVTIKDRMTLRQLGAMIKKCDLFLSNDTGPMHISVAVGTATIALFGPGNHVKFQPIGDKHALIRKDVPCSPCKQFTDKCKDNICMKLITVDEVWEEASKRLNASIENRKSRI
jgi:ADP-heptose:LPS heptosyltransferase